MSSGRFERPGSSHSAGLLLRVVRSDGRADEFYLAHGLTIGRSVANAVVLADDESVDRTHARVEMTGDGPARLVCVEPGGALTVDGASAREIPLDVGVRFRIGRTWFECVSGRREAEAGPLADWRTCPFCGSAAISTEGEGPRQCPGCGGRAIAVPLGPPSPGPVLVPVEYGRHRADRYVARGGMGLVLKGKRADWGATVAIKVLLPGSASERFGREVAMLERVRHPNVVKLLDHGEAGRCSYLAFEWVEGWSLREVIAENRSSGETPDFAVAFRWFKDVVAGLAAIHDAGIVHRDLKPSNVLIGPEGRALISDLGIARRIDGGQTALTTTGHALGTFEYMAPEQHYAPDAIDGRADLYALGATFHELLTGARPLGFLRPASELNLSVPPSFDAILRRLTDPDPNRRFPDVSELISALDIPKVLTTPSGETGSSAVISESNQNSSDFGMSRQTQPSPTLESHATPNLLVSTTQSINDHTNVGHVTVHDFIRLVIAVVSSWFVASIAALSLVWLAAYEVKHPNATSAVLIIMFIAQIVLVGVFAIAMFSSMAPIFVVMLFIFKSLVLRIMFIGRFFMEGWRVEKGAGANGTRVSH